MDEIGGTFMAQVELIPLDLIITSPFNVRKNVVVESLADSINRSGQLEPIRVRPVPGGYEIITGKRRFAALQMVGATHVDAIVCEGSDEEVVLEQWDENEEREQYSDYEKALKLEQIKDKLGLTQEGLGEKIGRKQNWISRHLAMLKLEGIIPIGILSQMKESQARAFLQASEEDWSFVASFVEAAFEESGQPPPSTTITEYINELKQTKQTEIRRRQLLDEEPKTDDSRQETRKAYIAEHDLDCILRGSPNDAHYLTKLAMITDDELEFCLAHESRLVCIRRLNEEKRRRGLETKESVEPKPESPTRGSPSETSQSSTLNAFIYRKMGVPVEELRIRLVKELSLTENKASEALAHYKERHPDIWKSFYTEHNEPKADEDDEEDLTIEEYVEDIFRRVPDVDIDLLTKTVAGIYDVQEAYVRGIIKRLTGKKRGRRPQNPYSAARSPTCTCPLCGRANAEKNRILIIHEEYHENNPTLSLVEWLENIFG